MIHAWKAHGNTVVQCHSRHPIKAIRVLKLIAQYLKWHKNLGVVVVGASCHAYIPLAWILCRLTGKPLIFDAFVSHYENWQERPRKGWFPFLQKQAAFFIDKISTTLPDLVLLDTEEHVAYFQKTFGLAEAKVRSIPVGADGIPSTPREHANGETFKVLFVGSFLPLHGMGVIVQAAELIKNERGILFELVGDGEERLRVERLCQNPHVLFQAPIPYEEYVRKLLKTDVALGVFGTTPKTDRVIPCKVYDALAAGVPLITADTPAVRRFLRNGRDAVLVTPGDPRALAAAILSLKRNPKLRMSLANEGKRTFGTIGTPEMVGRALLSICTELLGKTMSS